MLFGIMQQYDFCCVFSFEKLRDIWINQMILELLDTYTLSFPSIFG